MRFIGNILRLLIITLLGLWALSFMGYGPFDDWLDKWLHPSQESLMERAQKIRNFDPKLLDPEFEIERVGGLLDDYNTLVAKHVPTGQKMFMADGRDLLTQQDLLNGDTEKIAALFDKIKTLGVSPEGVEVTKTGVMDVFGEEVAFAEFAGKSATLGGVPVAGMVTTTKDGSQVLASTNDKGKWSHFPDDGFFGGRGRPHRPGPGLPCVCD